MSKSLIFTIKAISHIVDYNPTVLEGIANWVEENKSSVLHQQEQNFVMWSTSLMDALKPEEKKYDPYPFRFNDQVWIMLKIEMFAYHVITTSSGSFLSTVDFGFLACLEQKTDLQRKLLCNSNFVTKLEMISEEGKRLTEFNEFTLKYCRMTYSDNQTYEGSIYIHPIGGPLKHGSGTLFDSNESIVREGKWVFDEIHYQDDCVCDICDCYNYTQPLDDNYDYEDFEEQDLMCCFHGDKEEWNIALDWDSSDVDSIYDYCAACLKVLEPLRRKCDEGFLELAGGGGDWVKKSTVKDITSYEDYVNYVM
jgi:hypothetical protein